MTRSARFSVALVLVGILFVLASRASAYTYAQVAVDGNLLVSDDRIVFIQGTGSLTALKRDTGEVLLRKKPTNGFEYSGVLQNLPAGVLMIGYSHVALLNSRTFEPIWQCDASYNAVAESDFVCYHNGDHTVTCRNARTGGVNWTADVQYGWALVVAKGRVAVFTPPDYDSVPHGYHVFDLASGQLLLGQQLPAGTRWLRACFDGDLIYLVEKSENSEPWSPRPGRLTVLNLQGEIVAQEDGDSKELKFFPDGNWDGRCFWRDKFLDHDGSVRSAHVHEIETLASCDIEKSPLPQSIPSGMLECVQSADATGTMGAVFRMTMPQGSWRAYAPYLASRRIFDRRQDHFAVSESDGLLFLATSEGQIECLASATGAARWIYVFPPINRTMYYSSPHGLPPYLTELVADYRHNVQNLAIDSGSLPLPEAFNAATGNWAEWRKQSKYQGQTIIDPSPDDPYPDLGRYYLMLAAFALVPIAVAGIYAGMRRRQRAVKKTGNGPALATVGFGCLLLSLSPAVGLFQYGHVSFGWTLILKLVFLVSIGVAVSAAWRLFSRRRWRVALILSVLLTAWICFMTLPLMYA